MDPSIKKILKVNRVDTDGVFHTHVSLIKPRGKFQFNRQALEEFWDVYCENKEGVYGIAEKPQQYLPILADIDLRVKDDGTPFEQDSLYTEDQLKTVVEVYQSVIKQIVDRCTSEDLLCVVLEKKMYMQTKTDVTYYKHGFHLHFPYCFLSKESQETHLIPRVKTSMKELAVFRNLGIEDSGEIVDKVCCRVPWLLYGARKSEEAEPYKVTKVYDENLSVISLEKAFKNYKLYDQREQLIPLKGQVEKYLPRILSILPYGRDTKELRKGLISPLKENMKKKEKKSSVQNRAIPIEKAMEIARRLVPLLSDWRAEDRNEWITIGWVLYNISEGSPDALDLWCEFSSRCDDKYDENVCIYQWERMTKGDVGIGTLKYYAKLDNPAEYRKFVEERSAKHIQSSLEGSHNDIAKALNEEYGDVFTCASITNRVWFQFVNHKWEQIEEGVFLREKISGRFVDKYTEAIKLLADQQREADKATEMMITHKMKQLNKMISNLKNASFKNNVMREACEVFFDPQFKEKLDMNPYLIAFKNGVYDLQKNVFRPGRPEDYISKSMPINYTEFTEDDDRVQNVKTFIEQVFPDKSLRQYFMDISSDIFVGGNHQKTVVFWTGEGDNGKSVTQCLFEKMLGKLAIKLNTTIITGKKPSAGSAFADLARAGGGVRWAVLEEPDGDEAINTGMLKNLSGNDSFYARDLFEKGKDGREIQPLFKLIFICLTGDTRISLANGTSLRIKDMTGMNQVLSWNNSTGLIPLKQEAFFDQGVRDCVKLTLYDGREITCTPNHKFLCENDTWIEAGDIIPGETRLRMGPDYPDVSDSLESYPYTIKAGNFVFDLTRQEDRNKAMAFARLLGSESQDIDDYPSFMHREYLASLFTHHSELTENSITLTCVKDLCEKVLVLLGKFSINSTLVDSSLIINQDGMLLFAEKIGFRNSLVKSFNLSIIASFIRYGSGTYTEYTHFLKIDYENMMYSMPVISRENAGSVHVYDISVPEPYSNFLAEGIVSHNCNKLPHIKHADKAVWNRVRVLPFETTFCRPENPAPESYEEQLRQKRFPMDKEFSKKIPGMLEPFAWLLLEHRKKIKTRIEPEKVRSATEVYKRQNDIYRQFIEEFIAEDAGASITLTEVYSLFKDWFRESLPGHTVPVKNEVEDYLSRAWGTPTNKKWKGYRQRTINDDVASGNAHTTDDGFIVYNNDTTKNSNLPPM
jgi:phage/plasmid-associated DNA primase